MRSHVGEISHHKFPCGEDLLPWDPIWGRYPTMRSHVGEISHHKFPCGEDLPPWDPMWGRSPTMRSHVGEISHHKFPCGEDLLPWDPMWGRSPAMRSHVEYLPPQVPMWGRSPAMRSHVWKYPAMSFAISDCPLHWPLSSDILTPSRPPCVAKPDQTRTVHVSETSPPLALPLCLAGSVSGPGFWGVTRYQIGVFATRGSAPAASPCPPCGSFYWGQTGSIPAVSVRFIKVIHRRRFTWNSSSHPICLWACLFWGSPCFFLFRANIPSPISFGAKPQLYHLFWRQPPIICNLGPKFTSLLPPTYVTYYIHLFLKPTSHICLEASSHQAYTNLR